MDQHHVEDESGDDEKEDLPRRRFNIEVNDNGLYCTFLWRKETTLWLDTSSRNFYTGD